MDGGLHKESRLTWVAPMGQSLTEWMAVSMFKVDLHG